LGIEKFLAQFFCTVSIEKDRGKEFTAVGILPESEKIACQTAISMALFYMYSKRPIVHEIFTLIFHAIFFRYASKSNGGSVSTAIGVLWANNNPSWSPHDTTEFLIHELTHQLMFIDDLCHPHYVDRDNLKLPYNLSRSAILNQARSIDKVLHSIVVLTEIIVCRRTWLGEPNIPRLHESTETLCIRVRESIQDIYNFSEHLLTKRGKEILRKCAQIVALDPFASYNNK
jgi:hypothetical protein